MYTTDDSVVNELNASGATIAEGVAITRFEKQMEDHPTDYVALTRWDSLLKLEAKVGQQVTILGSVNDVKLGDSGPTILKLSRSRGSDFDVVFFDKDVALSSGVMQNRGEYVQVRGLVNKRFDKNRGVDRLQMVVSLPGQVLAPSKELDALLAAEAEKEEAAPLSDPPLEEAAE